MTVLPGMYLFLVAFDTLYKFVRTFQVGKKRRFKKLKSQLFNGQTPYGALTYIDSETVLTSKQLIAKIKNNQKVDSPNPMKSTILAWL